MKDAIDFIVYKIASPNFIHKQFIHGIGKIRTTLDNEDNGAKINRCRFGIKLQRKGIPGIMTRRKQVYLSSTYFVLVNPFLIGFVSVGLYLLMMAWKSPDNVSPVYFGKLAHFVTWIGKNYSGWVALICWLTIVLHSCEGLASLYYCCIYGLNPLVSAIWIVQTLVVGILSLKYLIWPQYLESEKEE